MTRLVTNAVAWAAGRCLASLLALGLSLSGLGLCLCVPSPAKVADPHACCPPSAGQHPETPATETSVNPSSASCCASHVAPGITARIAVRDVLRHTLVAAASTAVSPDGQIVRAVIGSSPPPRLACSPPRKTVLRV